MLARDPFLNAFQKGPGMSQGQNTEIAVVGGGVIGLAIAHRLAAEGHEVCVIDPDALGSGASFGNAGMIADYAVLPVGTPDVLRNLPSLLFDRSSPLSIRRAALPTLAPWLLRFALQSLPRAARRNASSIAALLANAGASWKSLAADIDAVGILQNRGCLHLYETSKHFAAAGADTAFRRAMGVSAELLQPHEVAQMEPNLPKTEGGGVFFPDALSMSDPGQMVGHLADAVLRAGVVHHKARVDRLERTETGVRISAGGLSLTARRVVIAAGAHSRALARMVGDRVPLDTERGYHLEWDMPAPCLSRPVSPTSRGFYLCPMTGRLRVAGTVELGGLTAPPSPHRLKVLEQGARDLLPDLPAPDRSWMGFRPSMPDSVPVIGPSRGGAEVLHAYGHGHLGLTLAPVTARIIADLVAGRQPEVPMAPYLPTRF